MKKDKIEKTDKIEKNSFIQIAYRPLIEEKWMESGFMGDPIWLTIGEVVAKGELDHFVNVINKSPIGQITPIKKLEYDDRSAELKFLTNTSLKKVYEKIELIVDSFKGMKPDLMILPNELFSQFDIESLDSNSPTYGKIIYENGYTSLLIKKSKIRLMGINSNKFGDIAILNSKMISWIYKADT